jgi:uncharacterized integral membrane protein
MSEQKYRSPILDMEEKAVKRVTEKRDTYAQKYPLVFTLGAAFGLVATFYGFEKLIDSVPFLTNNAWFVLGLGITLLAVTGRFYNKLS